MEFSATPSDVLDAIGVVQQIDPHPVRLAGKVLGFSDAEQQAGIPAWAWMAVALGAGVALGVKFAPQIREALR